MLYLVSHVFVAVTVNDYSFFGHHEISTMIPIQQRKLKQRHWSSEQMVLMDF